MQLEDYGQPAAMDVLEASGRWAAVEGYSRIESDFVIRRQREKIAKSYPSLSKDVRDVYEGFAAGVDRYIELYPENFPAECHVILLGRCRGDRTDSAVRSKDPCFFEPPQPASKRRTDAHACAK
jgi:hypothetical protein